MDSGLNAYHTHTKVGVKISRLFMNGFFLKFKFLKKSKFKSIQKFKNLPSKYVGIQLRAEDVVATKRLVVLSPAHCLYTREKTRKTHSVF